MDVENLTFFLRANFDMSNNWTKSVFYKDVIQILYNLNKDNISCSKENSLHQYIFYNKHFKFNNEYKYDKQFTDAGIWKVIDLFDANYNVISFDTLKNRGISNRKYLLWRSLVTKAKNYNPQFVPSSENEHNLVIQLKTNDQINIQTGSSKDTYNKLVHLQYESPTSLSKYKQVHSRCQVQV